jgi:hypothetical protein
MDEMQLLREFGEPVELPDHDDLAPARAKLLAAASSAPTATVHPLRTRKRLMWLGATAVGLAAAITAVVALAPADNPGLPVTQANAAEAMQVLHAAAAAALKMPDTPPRPDQFVYIKQEGVGGHTYEGWFSADGTHDGLIKREGGEEVTPGCRNGKQLILVGNSHVGGLTDCQPLPAYDAALPADTDGMLAHLAGQYGGTLDNVNGIAKDVGSLLSMNYLRPGQRAALFEAVAKVPGITLTKNVKDAAGRTGDSISWDTKQGQAGGFVFDPATHAYLGWTDGEAQVAYGIVDKVDQVP